VYFCVSETLSIIGIAQQAESGAHATLSIILRAASREAGIRRWLDFFRQPKLAIV
jgi:hypothetical protein